MVWVLEARDMREVLAAVDAKAHREGEEEAIVLANTKFHFADTEPLIEARLDSAGTLRKFHLFYLREAAK